MADLTKALETEAQKANKDADLLKQIKGAVEKATKTVDELKALVNDLEVTSDSAKNQLLALITRIGNISSIFDPDEG